MFSSRKLLLLACVVTTLFVSSHTVPAQGPSLDTAASLIDRAAAAYGRPWDTGGISDSVADGKMTFFDSKGSKASFDFSLLRKGNTRVQRIIRQPAGDLKQGTDGSSSWESILGFYTPAAQGHTLEFLESQTSRSVPRLLNYKKESLTLRDLGMKGPEHAIEAQDAKGKRTTYFIDPERHVIAKLEVVTGQRRDPFTGAMLPETDTYVFSDNRLIEGAVTPFKIERYSNGSKTEEMQLTAVRYNTGLKDTDFHR